MCFIPASGVAGVGRGPTSSCLGRWGAARPSEAAWGDGKKDPQPVVSTVGCGGWDREGPLFSLLLVSSRMKVQEADSTSRRWLPFSSASGLSPGGLLST